MIEIYLNNNNKKLVYKNKEYLIDNKIDFDTIFWLINHINKSIYIDNNLMENFIFELLINSFSSDSIKIKNNVIKKIEELLINKMYIENKLIWLQKINNWINSEIWEFIHWTNQENRQEELWDLFYLLSLKEIKKFWSLNNFRNNHIFNFIYLILSVQDLKQIYIKFKQRNSYLNNKNFLDNLNWKTNEQKKDLIHSYWLKIKEKQYKKW